MLAFAKQENTSGSVTFLQSPAEILPFDDGTFDLITVSLAFHWLEREKFLAEASRVLKSNGWLIVYDNNFAAIMKENSDFETFFHETYPARYPPPARNKQPITEENLEPFGFIKVSSESYSNEVAFTTAPFVDYLMTHSIVIAKVEQGTESSDEARSWLTKLITKFLPNARGTFIFKGDIIYVQKEAK
jgi:ubiquinone/menaquinone biosynthesis C-methylase UbiE